MRLYELIVEGYKEAQQEFTVAAGNDAHLVKGLIDAYKELLNKNQIQNTEGNNERNIDYWRKQGLESFNNFVVGKKSIPTPTEIKRKKVPGKAITLREDDNWLIVIPLDKDASCFHGKNSDWCTTKTDQNYFEDYFYDKSITLIYCLNKKNAGMWAIAANSNTDQVEMFDQKDTSISREKFIRQTTLDPRDIVKLALGNIHKPQVDTNRKVYADTIDKINSEWNTHNYSKSVLEMEKLLISIKNPELCAKYIENRYHDTNWGVKQEEYKTEVDIPKSIMLAAVDYDEGVMQYVNKGNLPETTVLQIFKKNPHILKSMLRNYNWHPTAKLQAEFVKHDPKALLELINHQMVPQPSIIVDAINASKAKGVSAAHDLVSNLISTMIKKKMPIHHDVIDAAVSAHGPAVLSLLDANYKISPETIMSAIDSSGFILDDLYDGGYDVTTEMVYRSLKSSHSMTLSTVLHRDKSLDPKLIDFAIKSGPDSAIATLLRQGIEVTDDMQYTAITHSKDDAEAQRVLSQLYYDIDNYIPSKKVVRAALEKSPRHCGVIILEHYPNVAELDNDLLALIAQSSSRNARGMLKLVGEDPAILTDRLQQAMVTGNNDLLFRLWSVYNIKPTESTIKAGLLGCKSLYDLNQYVTDLDETVGITVPPKLIKEVEPVVQQKEAKAEEIRIAAMMADED